MLGIVEGAYEVEILSRGDVTQSERFADHVLFRGTHADYALNEDIAQTAFEQLGGERGSARVLEVLQRFGGDHVGAIVGLMSDGGLLHYGGRHDNVKR
jgi:hypothetical protein